MNLEGGAIGDGLVRGQTSWDHAWAARDGVQFLHDQGLPTHLADVIIADYLHYRSSIDLESTRFTDTTRPAVEAFCSHIRDSAHSGRHSCVGERQEFLHARFHGYFAVPGQLPFYCCRHHIPTSECLRVMSPAQLFTWLGWGTHDVNAIAISLVRAVICKCLKCESEPEEAVPEWGQQAYIYPLFEKGR